MLFSIAQMCVTVYKGTISLLLIIIIIIIMQRYYISFGWMDNADQKNDRMVAAPNEYTAGKQTA